MLKFMLSKEILKFLDSENPEIIFSFQWVKISFFGLMSRFALVQLDIGL